MKAEIKHCFLHKQVLYYITLESAVAQTEYKERRIEMTKINVISGFLGAGKTTLIKKLLAEAFQGQKIVLIENEFGEIGIDGGFLKEAGVEITEMNSGCICCSLVGDFGEALKEVLERFAPDRVIIEPSGVGKLSDVNKAVADVAKEIAIEQDCSITVADATKCKIYMKNFGEFFNNQIEHADIIVLSRTQNMKQEKLEASVKLLQEQNEKAAIVTTPWEELEGSVIVEALKKKELSGICPECGHTHEHEGDGHGHNHNHEEGCCSHHHEHEEGCSNHGHGDDCCGQDHHHEHGHEDCDCGHEHGHESCGCGHEHHHGHHHADEVFNSWGKETPHRYTKEVMENILSVLANENGYGTILRAKGIVQNEDGAWLHFDLVPGEFEVREGAADYTGRLCVIGAGLENEKLEQLFQLR